MSRTIRPGLPRIHAILAALLSAALAIAAAGPAEAHTPQEVEALVRRAAEHILAVGRDQAFIDITRPDGDFVDGELYVFCDSAAGIVLAHGDNPKLVGKSLATVRDREGKSPTIELFRIAQRDGAGWFQYLWPNSRTGRIERKIAYVMRIDDQTICASGYYQAVTP